MPRLTKMVLLLLVTVCLATSAVANDLSATQEVQALRDGMARVVSYLEGYPELFPRHGDASLPSRAERLELWQAWQTLLEQVLTLDVLIERGFLSYHEQRKEAKHEAFRVAYAGFLAQYRYALDFIDLAERNPAMHVLLNEPVPELGLPADTYKRFKFRFLNLLLGANFARLDLVYNYYGSDQGLSLTAGIVEDRAELWAAGKGRGAKQTGENALRIIQDFGQQLWFPLQKGVSEWMGDTKVWRWQSALISAAQIEALQGVLLPGDILLVRREWYLSNLGLPGFWPHAALYVGTPQERQDYFASPELRAWVADQGGEDGDFEALLQAREVTNYRTSLEPQEQQHLPRLIEAISEGVSFTTLEHSADGDALVVLRPKLPLVAKARAILRAFHYAGRPYDFNFDFRTDAALVCTELVSKAYEGDAHLKGLQLPSIEMLGRPVTPANAIARQFDEQLAAGNPQFEMIRFLDGFERSGSAVSADLQDFRASWQRPKWYIWVQGKPQPVTAK